MPPITNILELRRHLAERFPQLGSTIHQLKQKSDPGRLSACFHLEDLLAGRLPKRVITELIQEKPSAGSALILSTIIRNVCQMQWVGLIDSQDSFDPTRFHNDLLTRLLWIRCRSSADQALKAADLVLRDGNLPLVLLDLSLASLKSLRKIPATTWHRLQRIIEQSSSALLVAVPCHLVSCAQVKLSLQTPFTLDALEQTEADLLKRLHIEFEQKQFRAAAADSSDSGKLINAG